jgi:hypothetical protein
VSTEKSRARETLPKGDFPHEDTWVFLNKIPGYLQKHLALLWSMKESSASAKGLEINEHIK